jgi:hypothetical protein
VNDENVFHLPLEAVPMGRIALEMNASDEEILVLITKRAHAIVHNASEEQGDVLGMLAGIVRLTMATAVP